MFLSIFLAAWLVLNLVAMIAYGLDKRAAMRGLRRISEARLLYLTLLGAVGAMCASRLMRHKTRKQPFRRYADLLTLLHLIVVGFLVVALS